MSAKCDYLKVVRNKNQPGILNFHRRVEIEVCVDSDLIYSETVENVKLVLSF